MPRNAEEDGVNYEATTKSMATYYFYSELLVLEMLKKEDPNDPDKLDLLKT